MYNIMLDDKLKNITIKVLIVIKSLTERPRF